ncbi:hypothetical protein ANO11243_036960 [Dothideomycetidae sp. 11243]|nr:hypothetical protein ANO11243_036960 [fungal sp. No.11243]
MPSAVGRGKTRSSRFSSPRAKPTVTKKAPVVTSDWVEPPLKDAKPSYEEHGGSPYGVLEDMQALGQPPTAKARTRIKAEPLRKSLGRSFGATQDNERTVEASPSIDTPREASVVQEQPPAPIVRPSTEISAPGVADDFSPRASRRSTRSRRARASSAASEAVNDQSAVDKSSFPTSVKDSPPPETLLSPMMNELSESDIERVNFRTVVEIADRRAQQLGFLHFGAALRQVYAESQTNERYAHLLRAILLQSATEDEKIDFTTAIKRAKRTLRRAEPATAHEGADDLNGKTQGVHSRSDSPRPELVARPSIEDARKPPKIRLSLRRRTAEESEAKAEAKTGRMRTRNSRRQRADSQSSASSSSSVSSQARMVIAGAREDLAKAGEALINGHDTLVSLNNDFEADTHGTSHAHSNEMSVNSVLSANDTGAVSELDGDARSESTELIPVDEEFVRKWKAFREKYYGEPDDGDYTPGGARNIGHSVKRSPVDAGFDQEQLEAIEETKRRKLHETLYKDPGPSEQYRQSHLRESRESIEGPRHSRKEKHTNGRPTIRLNNGMLEGRARRGREPSDSPLSDMSSTPPLQDAMVDLQASRSTKKAKTKQSPEKKKLNQHTAMGIDEKGGRSGSVGVGGDDEQEVRCFSWSPSRNTASVTQPETPSSPPVFLPFVISRPHAERRPGLPAFSISCLLPVTSSHFTPLFLLLLLFLLKSFSSFVERPHAIHCSESTANSGCKVRWQRLLQRVWRQWIPPLLRRL